MSDMDCGHDDINQSVLGHCRACDFETDDMAARPEDEE